MGAQGDVIDEIGRHVAAGRAETERAAEQLRRADSSQRWHCGCRAIVVGVLLLVIALLLLLGRTERLFFAQHASVGCLKACSGLAMSCFQFFCMVFATVTTMKFHSESECPTQ